MTSSRQRVAIVGVGAMGSSLAANLVASGFHVVAYDTSEQACSAVQRLGAEIANSPEEAISTAPVSITCLPDISSFEITIERIRPHTDQSSSHPPIVLECSVLPHKVKFCALETLANKGLILLDTPLSGTSAQARQKDLVFFVSGNRAAAERCEAIFSSTARSWPYVGEFGTGSTMKLLANILVAVHSAAAAEVIALGGRAGLDRAQIVDVLGNSAGASRMLQVRGPLMVKSEFLPPTGRLDILAKDLKIIEAFIKEQNFSAPILDAAAKLYLEAQHAGLGGLDVAAVYTLFGPQSFASHAIPRSRLS